MTGKQSSVAIVFQDLSDSLESLRRARSSPKDVRRAFVRFVELSQKLTSVMRREFSEITGRTWEAARFHGWNDTTELFKKLRNVDQHESPIGVEVHERQRYPVGLEGDSSMVIEGTWELDDQLSDVPPNGMELVPADENAGAPSDTETYLREPSEYSFYLYPSNPEIQMILETIRTRDIHSLSEQCFESLQEYHSYYWKQLNDLSSRPA